MHSPVSALVIRARLGGMRYTCERLFTMPLATGPGENDSKENELRAAPCISKSAAAAQARPAKRDTPAVRFPCRW